MRASAENGIVLAVEVLWLAWSFSFTDHWMHVSGASSIGILLHAELLLMETC